MAVERSPVVIKPVGVRRGLTPELLERFQTVGLELAGLKLTCPSEDLIAQHYDEHHDKDFYPTCSTTWWMHRLSPPSTTGLRLSPPSVNSSATPNPYQAAPGTIRGDYAHTTNEHANNQSKPVKNLVHAAEDHDAAERELRPVGRLDTNHTR